MMNGLLRQALVAHCAQGNVSRGGCHIRVHLERQTKTYNRHEQYTPSLSDRITEAAMARRKPT